jgi:hypothetical protein
MLDNVISSVVSKTGVFLLYCNVSFEKRYAHHVLYRKEPRKCAKDGTEHQVFKILFIASLQLNLKAFHYKIINDHVALQNESKLYEETSEVFKVNNAVTQRNYQQIKQESAGHN